jgi:hypothetical protein
VQKKTGFHPTYHAYVQEVVAPPAPHAPWRGAKFRVEEKNSFYFSAPVLRPVVGLVHIAKSGAAFPLRDVNPTSIFPVVMGTVIYQASKNEKRNISFKKNHRYCRSTKVRRGVIRRANGFANTLLALCAIVAISISLIILAQVI